MPSGLDAPRAAPCSAAVRRAATFNSTHTRSPTKRSKVRRRAQHPIQPRRGHFQRVRRRDRILDIQQRRHLAAHPLAILDADALPAGR